MADTETRMREMLSAGGRFDPARAEQMEREIGEKYNRRLLTWRRVIWAMLALDGVCMVGLAGLFLVSESVKVQIACAAGFLFVYASSLLEKGAYWYMSLRYRVQRDLLELKLQVAKLANGQSGNRPS